MPSPTDVPVAAPGAATQNSVRMRDAFYALLFALAVLLGFALSFRSGFSIDDSFERETFEANSASVRDFISGADRSFASLNAYPQRYYGIGFHALSYSLRRAIAPLFETFQSLSPRDATLAGEHVATFVFFLFGAYCFYRILKLSGIGGELAALFVLFFLSNPYLLGHATMNIKDSPFMVAWLLCTWRMLVPCVRLVTDDTVKRSDFLWLGAATALLLSIRISGTLIGVQYLVAVAVTTLMAPQRMREHLRGILSGAIAFVLSTLLLTWAAYPIFWLAPWKIVEAIGYMSHHPWASCSMTWGQCLPAQDLPWFYVPAWLLVKLSIIGLLGFGLAIFTLLRPSLDPRRRLVLLVLVLSPALATLVLILLHANLYNEIRQVLFLVAMIYLAAFVALERYRAIAKPLLLAGLMVAAADNALAYPYQYVWFNEAARFFNITRNFETDYWALSTRETALVLRAPQTPRLCAFVPYPAQVAPYLPTDGTCLNTSFIIPADEPRPFLLSLIPHSDLQGYGTAAGCADAYIIQRRLLLSPEPITLSVLQICS